MSLVRNIFCSSLGKKYIMALTGLALIGFLTGHLVGNLQVFSHPDKINGYAYFLQHLGPALWAVRGGLLAIVALHIWAMTALTLENVQARPVKYGVKRFIEASWASRSMRWTGFIIAAFLVYHLMHFTIGSKSGFFTGESFKSHIAEYTMQGDFHLFGLPILAAGVKVHDVHTMMVLGFQNVFVSLFYIVAVTLLGIHIWHGFESAFQSLGLRTSRWGSFLRGATRLFAACYILGSIAIPAAVLAGVVKVGGCCPAATAAHSTCCPANQ